MRKPKPTPKRGNTEAVERRVRAIGETMTAFYRFSETEPSLWSKWRAGRVTPTADRWDRICRDIARFEDVRQRAAGAA